MKVMSTALLDAPFRLLLCLGFVTPPSWTLFNGFAVLVFDVFFWVMLFGFGFTDARKGTDGAIEAGLFSTADGGGKLIVAMRSGSAVDQV